MKRMVNQGNLLSKTLVIGIIFLFVGISVFSATGIKDNNWDRIECENLISSVKNYYSTYWDEEWLQLKHDSQGTGYINSSGTIVNNVLWEYLLGELDAYPSPATVGGKVYMTSANSIFYCFDAFSGNVLWSYPLYLWSGTQSSSPAVYEGKVYQGITYNYTYCWNALTGELIWKFNTNLNGTGYGGMNSLAAANGKIYAVKRHNNQFAHLFCLDADNGSLIWDYCFGVASYSSPAVYDGKVYIGSGEGHHIICFNGENGSIIWSKNVNGDVDSSPAVVDGKVYIGGHTKLWCLDASDGSEIWNYTMGGDCFDYSPSVGNGRVYYGYKNISCFDAETGELKWINTGRCRFIAVSQDVVYAGLRTGYLVCFDIENGDKIWSYQLGHQGCTLGPPTIAYNRIFISNACYPNPKLYSMGLIDTNSESPSSPNISGPASGSTMTNLNFTFNSVDPEGDDICFRINWGEGDVFLYGLFPSGEQVTISNNWNKSGNYTILAMARDINLKNSSWSSYNFTINVTHPVAPRDPNPSDNSDDVDVNNDLSWEYDYFDEDPIRFDVYLEADDSSPDVLVSNNQTETSIDPGHLNHSEHYYWKVVSWNVIGEFKSSSVWSFTTEDNTPPYPPNDPEPNDGASDVDVNATLSWSGGDPDNDSVTYDIYFGDSYPPPIVVNNQTSTFFKPGTMEYDTQYYWRIVSWDYLGLMKAGNFWEFTTGSIPNNPPYKPSDPSPIDGAMGVDIDADLSWIGGDPDEGDTVFYDVYLEADNPNPDVKVADDISKTWFDPGLLEHGTKYYWKIVARDNHYASTDGSVWHFSTEVNIPPNAPTIEGLNRGKPGVEYEYSFLLLDSNKDKMHLRVDWGSGTSSKWYGPYNSGTKVKLNHTWNQRDTFTIKAQAKDIYDAEGNWSEFEITIPRNRAIVNSLFQLFLERFPLLKRLLSLIRYS